MNNWSVKQNDRKRQKKANVKHKSKSAWKEKKQRNKSAKVKKAEVSSRPQVGRKRQKQAADAQHTDS